MTPVLTSSTNSAFFAEHAYYLHRLLRRHGRRRTELVRASFVHLLAAALSFADICSRPSTGGATTPTPSSDASPRRPEPLRLDAHSNLLSLLSLVLSFLFLSSLALYTVSIWFECDTMVSLNDVAFPAASEMAARRRIGQGKTRQGPIVHRSA